MLATLIAALFTALLVVGVPALSYSTARSREIREVPRLVLYISAVFSQWLLTLVGFGVVWLVARSVFVQGFAVVPLANTLQWAGSIALASLLALGLVIYLERRGLLPRESELVRLLIPETFREKLWSILILAPTAAFCEEFLFRGYLLTQLDHWLHSMAGAWILCSVAFGLAHFYQGWGGMIRAGLLGALLAYPVVELGSLYPSMLAHWLIDAVALVWLGPWLMRNDPAAERRILG
jgi:membrane protease YdiL (CAAX protease family)